MTPSHVAPKRSSSSSVVPWSRTRVRSSPSEPTGPGLLPRRDAAAPEGLVGVGDDELLVELEDRAQTVAGGAGAVGRVEREKARLELFERALGVIGAGVVLAVDRVVPGLVVALAGADGDDDDAGAGLERGLDAFAEALAGGVLDDDAVDDGLDGVLLVASEAERVLRFVLERLAQVGDGAVDPGADEALAHEGFEDVAVEALLGADDRGEDHDAGALAELRDGGGDGGRVGLVDGLAAAFGDGAVALLPDRLPAARLARAGEEQPQVVVDLGAGGDGRARVVAARALLDGDGGGQALDLVDIGLADLVEELTGVGRQALHVLALALGEDGVEGERRLARAREPGDDDEAVAGDVDVERLEVVLAGAADADDADGLEAVLASFLGGEIVEAWAVGHDGFHLHGVGAQARAGSRGPGPGPAFLFRALRGLCQVGPPPFRWPLGPAPG